MWRNEMKSGELAELIQECRDAKAFDDLKVILEALIEHCYFRQYDKEQDER